MNGEGEVRVGDRARLLALKKCNEINKAVVPKELGLTFYNHSL